MKKLDPFGTFCTKCLFGIFFTVYVVVLKIKYCSLMYIGYVE